MFRTRRKGRVPIARRCTYFLSLWGAFRTDAVIKLWESRKRKTAAIPARVTIAHTDPTLINLAPSLRADGHDVALFTDPIAAWDALGGARRIEALITRSSLGRPCRIVSRLRGGPEREFRGSSALHRRAAD